MGERNVEVELVIWLWGLSFFWLVLEYKIDQTLHLSWICSDFLEITCFESMSFENIDPSQMANFAVQNEIDFHQRCPNFQKTWATVDASEIRLTTWLVWNPINNRVFFTISTLDRRIFFHEQTVARKV